jgi:hypothetical protein
MLNILITIAIVSSILIIIYSVNLKKPNDILILILLYCYHIILSIFFYFLSFTRTSDAFNYYHRTLENINENATLIFSYGTKFIDYIVYFLIQYLDFSYFNTFLIFSSMSFLGIFLLYQILIQKKFIPNYYTLILFLPGVHFWTSSLGKDSLIFFFLSYTLWALIKNKLILLGISLLFIFLIRPHIGLMLIIAIIISFMIKSKVQLSVKIFSSFILFLLLFIVLQSVMQYVGINNLSIENIFEYINQRQQYNLDGGSSIIISEMNILEKYLTFWFRPLFENLNLNYLMVSFENTIYIFMSLYIIINRKYIIWNHTILTIFIYILLVTFILSSTTANFGIIVRQKIMLFPMFYYLFIFVINNKRKSLLYAQ